MRFDLDLIQKYVKPKSQVLDLGCGDGTLLANLQQHKQVHGVGLEKDLNKIAECIEKNIAVVEHDLNNGLHQFHSDSYDMVIMTLTLQAMQRPDKVLTEMLRVGKECIVTFPNFGHWKARWYLFSKGRMPVSDLLPYEWYNTPNIHFCTIKDFESLCHKKDITILNRNVLTAKSLGKSLCYWYPNLFAETAIYHLTR